MTSAGNEITVREDTAGDRLRACIRPEDIVIEKDEAESVNSIQGVVNVQTFLGKRTQYNVSTDIGELIVSTAQENVFSVGDNIILSLTPNKIVLIP